MFQPSLTAPVTGGASGERSHSRAHTTVSFEVMPPRRPENTPAFWTMIDRLLAVQPDFVSVTYGAGGKNRFSARDIVTRLSRDTPINPIAHLTCVGTSVRTVESVIEDYLDADVRTFLALRGDPPADDPDWRPPLGGVSSATELVALIRSVETRRCAANGSAALRAAVSPLTISVAAFPSGNPAAGTNPEQEVERLLLKQAAGGSFAITQLFWDPQTYISFVDKARQAGVYIPILAGLLVPSDLRRLSRTSDLTGITPPDSLVERLRAADGAEAAAFSGVAEAARIAREVLESGAPGLHLYTYNKPEPALALLEQIGLVEPAESVDSSASVKPSES